MYRGVDEERLFENLRYFLEQIMPVCRKYDIRMAIHPDDPAWSVFGLPRIMTNKENVLRIMDMVDDPHNGVAFCTGSFGTSRSQRSAGHDPCPEGRIHFAHVRNLKFNSPTVLRRRPICPQTAALICDQNHEGPLGHRLFRSHTAGPRADDLGRGGHAGYGLYDRALGAGLFKRPLGGH